MESLLVGQARGCITPPLGIGMVGYADRTDGAAAVHDDLFVNAVVLEAPDNTVALMAYDLCLLNLEQAAEFKGALAKATGLRPEQLLLNTSHTHAGPSVGGREGSAQMEDDYRRETIGRSVEVLKAALAETAPATFAVGKAPLDIGCNRRERMEDGTIKLGHNPEGPRLGELTVWHFGRSGAPDVVLFSTPMHGTTLGWHNLSLSAEWMGLAVQQVEARRDDLRAVFLQGCGADQDPYYSMESGVRGTFEEVEQHGAAAAGAVLQALDATRDLDPLPLRISARQAPLPDKQEPTQVRRLPLHGVRVGDAAVIALGCEAFVEYALFAGSVSPFDETLVLGYTDGNVGYLCTADAFATGGYETNTTRVAPESEQITKEAIREMLSALGATTFTP